MKKKCMIFGAGNEGKKAFIKINTFFDVLFYVDNNPNLEGKEVKGIPIVSADEMKKKLNEDSSIVVIISIVDYREILTQLLELEVKHVLIMLGGLLYYPNQNKTLIPYEEIEILSYQKDNLEEKNILYVQNIPCIRTNKIAALMKDRGYRVNLLYLQAPTINNSLEYQEIYDNVFTGFTINSLLSFINNSDFDIIHSSNTPDFLTQIMTYSNKPIVHDCHDLSSMYKSMTPDEMAVEYIANTKSSGVIYTTEGLRDIVREKFSFDNEKVFVLENLISNSLIIQERKEKLSKVTGEIHCVYEGGIVDNKTNHKYFEDIWMKIAEEGIHVHFYSPSSEKYCRELEKKSKFLHFEGNKSPLELAVEMSKYDVGLCILNVTQRNKKYLEYASPNKIQEYINAGIPVAVGNIKSQIDFVEGNGFGKQIDLEKDILKQLNDIKTINIPSGILQEKQMTMESKIPQLISFYDSCIERYKKKC